MFFYLSKILWLVIAPANLLLLLLLAGAALLFTRFIRAGRRLVLASALGFFVLGILPVSTWMMRTLEDRFPPPAANMPAPTGIIVLGGALDEQITRFRGPIELTEGGDRMTEGVMLARRFPDAKVIFTGGSAALLGSPDREAQAAEKLFLGLGIPQERLILESESRNTYENAIFTLEIVKPKAGDVWLLVTSASHMPRSVGIFRKAGFNVTPYPVDYATLGVNAEYRAPFRNVTAGLRRTEVALREYIGLVAYWWTGKTDDLFPAP
ncbi:MAG: YdcF family protein [Beijerinckiaceae bacterium]|nr:YdcF family protein [Beijerinckiaceae bacterium]